MARKKETAIKSSPHLFKKYFNNNNNNNINSNFDINKTNTNTNNNTKNIIDLDEDSDDNVNNNSKIVNITNPHSNTNGTGVKNNHEAINLDNDSNNDNTNNNISSNNSISNNTNRGINNISNHNIEINNNNKYSINNSNNSQQLYYGDVITESEIKMRRDIENLNKKLEQLQSENFKLEDDAREKIKKYRRDNLANIRSLEVQERLLLDQIQQFKETPLPTDYSIRSDIPTFKCESEIELVALVDHLSIYQKFLEDQFKESKLELKNEQNLLEQSKEIGNGLNKNKKSLEKSNIILSKKLVDLVKKKDFQMEVLYYFLNNYKNELYDDSSSEEAESEEEMTSKRKTSCKKRKKEKKSKPPNEILLHLLDYLFKLFDNEPNGYVSSRDPIARPSDCESISKEVEILLNAGLIETHPTEPFLIRLVNTNPSTRI